VAELKKNNLVNVLFNLPTGNLAAGIAALPERCV
jgi:hydroxypyruvate isomerase